MARPPTISQASNDQFFMAQYINQHAPLPKTDDQKVSYNIDDFAAMSKLMAPVYDRVSNSLSDIKLTAASNVPAALSELQQLFSDKIRERLKELLNSLTQSRNPQNSSNQQHSVAVFAGGLQNAIQLYIALAKVAYQKLQEFHKTMDRNFDENLEALLKNNRHISTQFAKIHATILKLIENINGTVANQPTPYQLADANFSIASHPEDNQKLYLLPTMKHLDNVIELTKKPETQVSVYSYREDSPGPVAKKFSEEHKGTRLGCPLFRAVGTDGISSADSFFKTMDSIIQEVCIPKQTEGGILTL